MKTIDQIRKEEPAYKDWTDEELSTAMYNKYFSAVMPKNEFEIQFLNKKKTVSDYNPLPGLIGGAEIGFSKATHGLVQPLLESGYLGQSLANASRQVGNAREQKYEELKQQNPISAPIGEFAGEFLPILGGGAAALKAGAKVAPQIAKTISELMAKKGAAGLGARTGAASISGALGSAIPYAPEDESKMANAALGAVYGGLTAPVLGAVGKGFGALRETVDPYVEALRMSKMGQFLGKQEENIPQFIRQNEGIIKQQEGEAYKRVKEMAEEIDQKSALGKLESEVSKKFDPSPFHAKLEQRIKELKEDSINHPSRMDKNKESIEILESIRKDKLSNWGDLLEERKVINDLYGYEKTPGKSLPFETIDFARKSLLNTANEIFENNPMPEFKKAWDEANLITEKRKKEFDTLITRQGKETKSPYFNFKFSETNPEKGINTGSNVADVVRPYIPKDSKDGVAKIEQFYSMVGDINKGKELLKPYTFSDSIAGNTVDLTKFFNRYDKLSEEQRGLLFDPSELARLNKSARLFKDNPRAFGIKNQEEASKIMDIITNPKVAGGVLGGALGAVLGPVGVPIGGALGAAGATFLQKSGPKLALGITDSFDTLAASNPYKNINKYVSEYLAAAIGNRAEKKKESK